MATAEHDNPEMKPWRNTTDVLLGLIVAIGAALRVAQYVVRPSLWLDEAMLAISIVSRRPRALIFSPLEFNQSAPPLYLQLAKLSTEIFGPTEMALRLPAFISSILALFFFALIARRVLKGTSCVIAVLLFAIAPFLLIYSAEVKQYSGDALAASLLIYVAIRLHASGFSRKWLAIAAATALTIVWLSDTSIIVIGGLGIGLLYLAVHERDQKALRTAALLAPVWILAALAAAFGTRRRLAVFTGKALHTYWSATFMPLIPRNLYEAMFLPRLTSHFFAEVIGVNQWAYLCLIVLLVGIWSMWKRPSREAVALLLGPLIVGIIASGAKMYPYAAGRASLYLIPTFIIFFAAGIERIGQLWPKHSTLLQVAIFLFFVRPQPFVIRGTTPPWLVEPIEPVLSKVAANRKPGDRIYVFWSAVPATTFYGPRHGLPHTWWIPGRLHGDDWHDYTAELDKLRGTPRLWVIFSHSKIPGQREGLMAHLDSIGVRQPGFEYPAGEAVPDQDASEVLYDLRGPARASTSSTSSTSARPNAAR